MFALKIRYHFCYIHLLFQPFSPLTELKRHQVETGWNAITGLILSLTLVCRSWSLTPSRPYLSSPTCLSVEWLVVETLGMWQHLIFPFRGDAIMTVAPLINVCGYWRNVDKITVFTKYYFLCIIIAATSPAGWRPTVTCSWCLSEWVTPLICYSSRMGRCTNDLHYIKIQKSPNQT